MRVFATLAKIPSLPISLQKTKSNNLHEPRMLCPYIKQHALPTLSALGIVAQFRQYCPSIRPPGSVQVLKQLGHQTLDDRSLLVNLFKEMRKESCLAFASLLAQDTALAALVKTN